VNFFTSLVTITLSRTPFHWVSQSNVSIRMLDWQWHFSVISQISTNWMKQRPYREPDTCFAGNEIPVTYGSQRFITAFTWACHCILSRDSEKPVHILPPYFFKTHFNIIPSFMFRSLVVSFHQNFELKYFIYFLLYNFLHPHGTSSFVGSTIMLNMLLSNILNLHSSLMGTN
jgi:hypothetical protein